MKNKKILSMNFLGLMCFSILMSIFSIDNVNARTYDPSKVTEGDVTTRELAMLASLVYENVPNDYAYTTNTGKGCLNKDGSLKSKDCFYTFDNSKTYKLKGFTTQKVHQYIEGMSERKVKSIVSFLTSAFEEPGERYYFLNFAHTIEMEDRGWSIFDYETTDTLKAIPEKIQAMFPNAVNFEGIFDAVTFRRGNNFVIAYRGTDFSDAQEWIDDILYAVTGKHSEAELAYYYAQSVYDEIMKETNNAPNTKIYITGHSLGAYLAQVGGAAIVDKEAGKTFKNNEPTFIDKNYATYNELTNDYKLVNNKSQSHLVQVAYFNGMGVGGLFGISSKFTRQVQNSLVYLSTHTRNGALANNNNSTGLKLNYSNNVNSSSRLVLYSMDSDPISSIGLHFGEIYKLEVGADAITNHKEKHGKVIGQEIQNVAKWYYETKEEYDKFIEDLTNNEKNNYLLNSANTLESLIMGVDSTSSSNLDAIPDLVSNQIAAENPGVNIKSFNLGALLENLTNDVYSFGERYGMTSIIDHFNANHETDSFVCLMDSVVSKNGTKYTNGDIENIKLDVYSVDNLENYKKNGLKGIKNKCNNGVCNFTVKYNDNGFKLTKQVLTENYVGQANNVMLVATIDNACAKEYTWYYSTSQNGTYTILGTTTDNKIIIPKDKINAEGNTTLYFKVSATYGDTYTSLQSKYYEGRKIIEYQKNQSYSGNPTLDDGINDALVAKSSTTSQAKKVSITVDTKGPECYFKKTTENVRLKRKFLGYKDETVELKLTCNDKVSGVNMSTFNVTMKKYETGLISSLKIDNKNGTVAKNETAKKFKVTATRVPTSKTPYVRVTGSIYDNFGNKTNIDQKVIFKITK